MTSKNKIIDGKLGKNAYEAEDKMLHGGSHDNYQPSFATANKFRISEIHCLNCGTQTVKRYGFWKDSSLRRVKCKRCGTWWDLNDQPPNPTANKFTILEKEIKLRVRVNRCVLCHSMNVKNWPKGTTCEDCQHFHPNFQFSTGHKKIDSQE